LHLDEYKATGTKSWELAIRDEHGRLLFSVRLKKRDTWHIQAILRWLRILGLRITVVYVDFWHAYPPAIKAIYPKAVIQYDFFHVMQNIHRHLYKALTAYRKALKAAKTEHDQDKVRKAVHAKLWQNRYVLFTNEEGLSLEQQQTLDELLAEHADTIVEQIVVFRQHLRTLFNESESFGTALEHLATLILEGWADVADAFGKIMTFLQEHFDNICTYLRVPTVQRNSLSECTVRSLRRIEHIRQGFKTHQGRVNHLKLLQWRTYMRSTD
jgi:transposase